MITELVKKVFELNLTVLKYSKNQYKFFINYFKYLFSVEIFLRKKSLTNDFELTYSYPPSHYHHTTQQLHLKKKMIKETKESNVSKRIRSDTLSDKITKKKIIVKF